MSDADTIAARLKEAWRLILDAEELRGKALAGKSDPGEAQEEYQAALTIFRRVQIEWAAATLGIAPLILEQLHDHEIRLQVLEARAVGEAPRLPADMTEAPG